MSEVETPVAPVHKTIEQLYIEYEGRKRMVGEIWNRTFYKRIRGSEHIHQKSKAIGIDYQVFEIVEMECDWIKILDEETGTLYEIAPMMYRREGFFLEHKPHRKQTFLPIKFFKVTKNYVRSRTRNRKATS